MRREKVLEVVLLGLFNRFSFIILLFTFSNKLMATLSSKETEMLLKFALLKHFAVPLVKLLHKMLPKHFLVLGYLVV